MLSKKVTDGITLHTEGKEFHLGLFRKLHKEIILLLDKILAKMTHHPFFWF